MVEWIVMHLQDVDPEAFFWVGGWVGVAIRWSPVLWLNLQMAGRREMRWYVFLFFFESETTGEKFSTFPKKRGWWRDDDWNWGCYDETQVFLGGTFWRSRFLPTFLIKRWSSWSCSQCFWWYPVIFRWLEKLCVLFWILSVRFRTRRMKPCLIHTWFQKTLEFLKWLNLPIRLQMLGFLQTQWSWMEHFTLKGRFPVGQGTIVACNFCEMQVDTIRGGANVLKMCCFFDGSFCFFSLKLRKRVMHTALANP